MANGAILGQTANTYSKEQIMDSTIPPLYGLGSDAVPNNLFQILSQAALYKTVSSTAQIGTLPEGSIIYLNENGSPVPFYVAKQGYEPNYNSNRVLVVRKDGAKEGPWNSSGVNTYDGSTIDTWFNQTYLQTLDSDVQSAISTTNIPATSPRNSGVIRLNKSVFALSLTELGGSASPSGDANTEGSVLPTAGGNELDPNNGDTPTLYRPSFTLPSDFTVYSEEPITGLYDVFDNLLLKLPSVQIVVGSYMGTGTYESSGPNSLTFDGKPFFGFVWDVTNTTSGISDLYIFPYKRKGASLANTSSGYGSPTTTWGENSIEWYSTQNAIDQLNGENYTYYYLFVLGTA